MERVAKVYEECKSIKEASRVFGCSETTIVKMLSTCGAYHSPMHDKVNKLFDDGMPVSEIAEVLNISISTANKYIPYSKGTYLTAPDEKNKKRKKNQKMQRK